MSDPYRNAWILLRKRIDAKTSWGRNELKSLMLECLTDDEDAGRPPAVCRRCGGGVFWDDHDWVDGGGSVHCTQGESHSPFVDRFMEAS